MGAIVSRLKYWSLTLVVLCSNPAYAFSLPRYRLDCFLVRILKKVMLWWCLKLVSSATSFTRRPFNYPLQVYCYNKNTETFFSMATFMLVSSTTIQPRSVSCNQLETRMLVSDWLQITRLGWIASELTMSWQV